MVTKESPTPENYHVAMKAFVRKGDAVLVMEDAREPGVGDLPGGRIGVGEFEVPFNDILAREIEEELGSDFRYRSNGPVAIFRHGRLEMSASGKPPVRIVMVGFELEYLGGDIRLSLEHASYQWVPLAEAPLMLPGGQADGMRKYLEYLENPSQGIRY